MTELPPLVPFRITICGLGELDQHAAAGIDHVVSILDPDYPDPACFRRYRQHRRVLYRFDDVIAARSGVVAPAEANVRAILDLGRTLLADKVKHVLIHCHAGVSRSTAAAIILMIQDNPGREEEAFSQLRSIRPRSWPNELMLTLAARLLGREGAFDACLLDHRRRIVAAFPELAEFLLTTERKHEVLGLGGRPAAVAIAGR
jgi:Predicted protein tyrosine phosphatase